jgi:hypothetical protein
LDTFVSEYDCGFLRLFYGINNHHKKLLISFFFTLNVPALLSQVLTKLLGGSYDTQHNDIQHNDTQHNDIQHNDTQHNDTKELA